MKVLSLATVLAIAVVVCCRSVAADETNTETGEYGHYDEEDYRDDTEADDPAATDDYADLTPDESGADDLTATTTTIASVTTTLAIPAEPCPTGCRCADGNTESINCTALGLTSVPQLPSNVVQLDLSHNNIGRIEAASFAETTRLRHLQLQHNQLTDIAAAAFAHARSLSTVDMSANRLITLDADVFAGASMLDNVSLAFNPLVLDAERPLLNLPELKTLSLEGCGLSNVYNATFRQLTGLRSLNLRNNSFDENLNVVAFENMTALERLTLVKLPMAHITELCHMLAVIDAIATDDIEVSCFEVMAGQAVTESIHLAKSKIPAPDQKPPPVERRRIPPTIRQTNKTSTTDTVSSSSANHKNDATTNSTLQTVVTSSTPRPDIDNGHNATVSEDHIHPSNGTRSAETAQPTVNIETHKLRKILIISMVVAVVGLLIGIVCRIDLCGVKTKLCRTRTRGPAATDQVQPAEQVPLKDIELGPIKAVA